MKEATGPGWTLRLGCWQDVLADVEVCDAVITDPPYGERTHAGQRHGRRQGGNGEWCSTRGLGYASLDDDGVAEMVQSWSPRALGWVCIHTSHDLLPSWQGHLEGVGRYVFAPLACVISGMNVRLAGDGPSSWCVWMVVARPRSMKPWGTLPGAYVVPAGGRPERAALPVAGAKPLGLMRAIIRDYTRPGDLVVDPYAGGGTTLLAAAMEGRRSIGAECDPETFAKAVARLSRGVQPSLFSGVAP